MFKKLNVDEPLRLKMAIYGESGSGKTTLSLKLAKKLATNKKIAIIDTEHKSVSKVARFLDLGGYDVAIKDDMKSYSSDCISQLIREAETFADVIIIDSISHEWQDCLDKAGSFGDWKQVSPKHDKFIQAILASPSHIICTMRAKEKLASERENGKISIKSRGVLPIQRDTTMYEFDIVLFVKQETHEIIVDKSRIPSLDGMNYEPALYDELEKNLESWVNMSPVEDMVINESQKLELVKRLSLHLGFDYANEKETANQAVVDWLFEQVADIKNISIKEFNLIIEKIK